MSYFGHAWPKYVLILATHCFAAKIIYHFVHVFNFGHGWPISFWPRHGLILATDLSILATHRMHFGHASHEFWPRIKLGVCLSAPLRCMPERNRREPPIAHNMMGHHPAGWCPACPYEFTCVGNRRSNSRYQGSQGSSSGHARLRHTRSAVDLS